MLRLVSKTSLLLIAVLFTLPVFSTRAQTDAPPDLPKGEVTGVIVNRSDKGRVPDSMEVMLHIWDANFTARGMLHGQSGPGGWFRFDEVPLDPGLFYAVMASYAEVTYFSEPARPAAGAEILNVTVPIYETRPDLSQASVDQMHVFFVPEQGGLGVTEIYVLQNQGNFTIKASQSLDDGTPVTLKFTLPGGAANVSFQSDDRGRFVQIPGGFADMAPLTPGAASSRVVVSYILPYTDGMQISISPPLDTRQLGFLVPQGAGLKLAGEELIPEGEMTLRDGLAVDVFSHPGLKANNAFQVTLSGELRFPAGALETTGTGAVPPTAGYPDAGLAVGVVVLGVALVLAGVRWWHQLGGATDGFTSRDAKIDALISETDILDDAFAGDQVDENHYLAWRENMLQQARAVMGEDTDE